MSVFRCRDCGTLIEWLTVRGGKRMRFNHELVDVGQAPIDNRWTVVRVDGRAVLVPVARPGAARALLLHACTVRR